MSMSKVLNRCLGLAEHLLNPISYKIKFNHFMFLLG